MILDILCFITEAEKQQEAPHPGQHCWRGHRETPRREEDIQQDQLRCFTRSHPAQPIPQTQPTLATSRDPAPRQPRYPIQGGRCKPGCPVDEGGESGRSETTQAGHNSHETDCQRGF